MGEKLDGSFILKILDTDEEVMRIDSADVIVIDESVEENQYSKVNLPERLFLNNPITFTCNTCYINRNLILSALYGEKITNNWLKMHGGVMTRKGKGRKHRNKEK